MGEDRSRDDDERSEAPRDSAEAARAVVADADPQPEGEAAQAYHQRARLAEDRLSEVLGAYRKLKTDNEGHRERITRNLDRRYEQRRERLLLKFIDILDNLDRALEAAQLSYAGEPLLEGMILVRTQLLQVLQDEGLERIPVVGLPFDPHLSESVGTQPVDDPELDHMVVKELMRGYRLNGRIARASTVLIGVYAPPAAPEGEVETDPAVEAAVVGLEAILLPARQVAVEKDDEPAELVADAHEIILPEEPEAFAPSTPLFPPSSGEPSLEEIIARAEAQDAVFPEALEPIEADPEPDSEDED